ncbi:MAG: hypothetical protein Kow0092_39100 [Deferrisomatales bacterium]
MTVKEIRAKARTLKVKNYSRLRKADLIWAVQEAEGHTACFRRISGCGITECCWRGECQG